MLRTRQREASVEEPPDGDGGMSAGAAYSSPPAMPSAAAGPISVPAYAPTGGLVASLLIGGVAGPYPAVRAARLPHGSTADSPMTRQGRIRGRDRATRSRPARNTSGAGDAAAARPKPPQRRPEREVLLGISVGQVAQVVERCGQVLRSRERVLVAARLATALAAVAGIEDQCGVPELG
jgi:hypothetical protein